MGKRVISREFELEAGGHLVTEDDALSAAIEGACGSALSSAALLLSICAAAPRSRPA